MKTVGFISFVFCLFFITSLHAISDKNLTPIDELGKKIRICHYPPGNPENPQSIIISKSAWPAHEAHGDSKGVCDDGDDHDNECGFISCDDLDEGQKLFSASSSTTNGSIQHSFWAPDLFGSGTAKFDFSEGQLIYDEGGAKLIGKMTLTEGGGDHNNSTWIVNVEFVPTDIVNPKIEISQPQEYIDTWIYYELDDDNSYFYKKGKKHKKVELTKRGNPFQIGLGAGNKDINEFSASAWFNWSYKGNTGVGDININIEDLCPPDGNVKPVLECVDYDNNSDTYTAHFGYLNENDENIYITVGNKNKFTPSPVDRGQTVIFEPGRQTDIFQVDFDGSNLVWTLTSPNGSTRTSTASNNPEQRCEPDPCLPESINGGSIAFTGPYNPNGTNTITNVELPSSSIEDATFEYIWMQSEVNVPNTPGNPHWSPVEGSANLTEINISGLNQTMYYVRCARITGCDMYWGETNTVEVEVDPCEPAFIDGGSISFAGPYNPNETNTITNVELPSSSIDDATFEYIWMQSEVNVPNTPGNPHWSPVEGSANLTEINISGLSQTMYYVRCARITGCDMYWGETNTVEVEVDPCEPAFINGGSIAFTDPYNPNGTNTITNVELPSSSIEDATFEYIWMQSEVNVPNTPGNPHWSPVEGSANLTEINISGLSQTMYYVRCARITGCDMYWGETNTVEVEVFELPTATISGNATICEGETSTVTITLTGTAPWTVTYTDGTTETEIETSDNEISFDASAGTYSLVSVVDANYNGTVSGSATITNFETPTATMSGDANVCEGETATVTIDLTGAAPWSFTYFDGTDQTEATSNINTFTFEAAEGVYSLVSVSDANCNGTVSGSATINTLEAPTATISGDANVCEGETATVTINLTGTAPWTFTYTDGVTNTEETSNINTFSFEAGTGTYTLLSVNDANCSGSVDGSATITEGGVLEGQINLDAQYCADATIELTSTYPTTGTSFLWTTNGSGQLTNSTSSTAQYQPAENDGDVTFNLTVENGCGQNEASATTSIITVEAEFEIFPEPEENQLTVGLSYILFAPSGADSYSWNYGDGTASTGSSNSTTHTYESAGFVTITLTMLDQSCVGEAQGTYNVIDNTNLFVPNIVNPTSSNPDNNSIKVYGERISPDGFSFEIYNRWGLVVYQTSNLGEAQGNGWKGVTKNDESENNVFTYILRGSFIDGNAFEETGTITLVK